MTDTTELAVGSIVQLTEAPAPTRHWVWHAPLAEDVVTFGTLPDPRDARIADLESAWHIAQKAGDGLLALCKEQERRAEVAQARIAELEAALRIAQAYERDVWSAAARIEQLEAALREIHRLAYFDNDWPDDELLNDVGRVAGVALGIISAPERDMTITVEELEA